MWKQKSKGWLKRYLPAEIVGTITAIGAASAARLFSENYILIAYVGSIGEAIGFYTTIFIQHLLIVWETRRIKNNLFSLKDFAKIFAAIILEFGPAGLIDGLLLRPFFMYLFPILLNNFTLGILAGKIVGDFTFYFLVILTYEMKNYFKKI